MKFIHQKIGIGMKNETASDFLRGQDSRA